MELLQTYLDTLATSPYWQVTLAALGVTVIAFFANVGNRAKINAALTRRRAPPRRSRQSQPKKKKKALVVPEGKWNYDGHYLECFATKAASESVSGHGTALKLYINPTLRWDIVFAIALGLFTALFDFGMANALLSHPYASRVMLLLACMGVVYGAADVAEDVKLASILTNYHPNDLVGIDGGDAHAANVLTRVKFVALTLSVVGLVIFVILRSIATLISALSHEKDAPVGTTD